MMTPEEIALAVWLAAPRLGSPTLRNMHPDNEALIAGIAAAVRDAYERAAQVAEKHKADCHEWEDVHLLDEAAERIRALKGAE